MSTATPGQREADLKSIERHIVAALALARRLGDLPPAVTDPLKQAGEAVRLEQDMGLI
jgi:hypothetical protein